jgi:ABC-type lipoprotein export system ATPase subunit
MNSIGSVWRKCDFHIHTPVSYKWDGPKFDTSDPAQEEAYCKHVLDAINSAEPEAFCIMDYWTFEGYILLRNFMKKHPDYTKKTIFPGMEFRIISPTEFRLNCHVLICNTVPDDMLRSFTSTLRFAGRDGKAPQESFFADFAVTFDPGKLKHHGFKEEDRKNPIKMAEFGRMVAELSWESVRDAMKLIGGDRCLLILPWECSDGLMRLKWQNHSATDRELMQWADCFESRKDEHINLFLGLESNQALREAFIVNLGGYPKPAFSGSDAHEVGRYGVFHGDRPTWLKAQLTFKGLRQICCEPALRSFIGEKPEKLKHIEQNPTKYIKSLKLSKIPGSTLDEDWFDSKELHLNPGLIAIVGNKGSGKSALADIIALAGNAHCSNFEFLTPKRFRGTGNKAQHFTAELTWLDNRSVPINLGTSPDLRSPERVRYLPQHFIEQLCNDIEAGNEERFSKELQKVIFSHVTTEERLNQGTMDDLLEFMIRTRRESFNLTQQSLKTLNDTIFRKEQEGSPETIKTYETSLLLKEAELTTLDATLLTEVPKPSDTPDAEAEKAFRAVEEFTTKQSEIARQIADLNREHKALLGEEARLRQLLEHTNNFEKTYKTFCDQRRDEFTAAGLVVEDIVKLAIDRTALNTRIAQIQARTEAITAVLSGTPATATEGERIGLIAEHDGIAAEIVGHQARLDAPQRAYQAFLKEKETRDRQRTSIVGDADTPGTIEFLKGRIQHATTDIPTELTQHKAERRELVKKLHGELLEMRQVYMKLYAPVQKVATEAASSAYSVKLQFDATVADAGFEQTFFDFIHRGKKGTFYGEADSRTELDKLVGACDFNDTDSVADFTEKVLDALIVNQTKTGEKNTIASQLREKKKVADLYDFIFGLNYLEIRYNLRLGTKDISKLSPGEKGALLLVFYLLLDIEETPIVIDQPEHNLDNESVVRLLVECIRKARVRRQVIIVTHNPNLAVYCDADQVICCTLDKENRHRIDYESGAIEDYPINKFAVNVLEGTYAAFDNRSKKWHKPE